MVRLGMVAEEIQNSMHCMYVAECFSETGICGIQEKSSHSRLEFIFYEKISSVQDSRFLLLFLFQNCSIKSLKNLIIPAVW